MGGWVVRGILFTKTFGDICDSNPIAGYLGAEPALSFGLLNKVLDPCPMV